MIFKARGFSSPPKSALCHCRALKGGLSLLDGFSQLPTSLHPWGQRSHPEVPSKALRTPAPLTRILKARSQGQIGET